MTYVQFLVSSNFNRLDTAARQTCNHFGILGYRADKTAGAFDAFLDAVRDIDYEGEMMNDNDGAVGG